MFLIKWLAIDYFLIMLRHMWVLMIEEFQKIVWQLSLFSSCPPSLIECTMTRWKSVCHCLSLLTWPSRRILWPRLTDSLNRLLFFSVLEVWWTGWNWGILHTWTCSIEHILELLRWDRSGLSWVVLCVLLRRHWIRFIWVLLVAKLLFFIRSVMLVHRVVGAWLVLKSLEFTRVVTRGKLVYLWPFWEL